MGLGWSAEAAAPPSEALAGLTALGLKADEELVVILAARVLEPLPHAALAAFRAGTGSPERLAEAVLRDAVLADAALCRLRPGTELAGRDAATERELALAPECMHAWPELAAARHRLVPGRVKEAFFWANFFDAVQVALLRVFLSDRELAVYTRDALELLEQVAWEPAQLAP